MVDSVGCQTVYRTTHYINLGQFVPDAQTLSPDLAPQKESR